MKLIERLFNRHSLKNNGQKKELSVDNLTEQINQLGLNEYLTAEEVATNELAFSFLFISLAWQPGKAFEHLTGNPNDYYALTNEEVETLVGGHPKYLAVENQKYIKKTLAGLSYEVVRAWQFLEESSLDDEIRQRGYQHLTKIISQHRLSTTFLGLGHIVTLDKQRQEETVDETEENEETDFYSRV